MNFKIFPKKQQINDGALFHCQHESTGVRLKPFLHNFAFGLFLETPKYQKIFDIFRENQEGKLRKNR